MNKYKVSEMENNSVLKIEEVMDDQVIFKVKELTNLEIAKNPMFNSNMDYITVTRGNNHTLTIVNKDGTTSSFYWGTSGHTLISSNLERLKRYVMDYAKNNLILLKHTTNNFTTANAYYNDNFNAYQLTIVSEKDESDYLHFDTAEEREKYIEALNLVKVTEEPNEYVGTVVIYKRAK